MNYTTQEQSKKLLELGLDPSTADMYYDKQTNIVYIALTKGFKTDWCFPCWSTDRLLDLMPKPLEYQGSFCYPELDLFTHRISYTVGAADYIEFDGVDNLDSSYKMMIWLLKNNYIKQNKHD